MTPHAPLRLIHPIAAPVPAAQVSCGFSLRGSLLKAEFQVRGVEPLSLLEGLQGPGPHWGVWEGDVVEVFLRVGGSEYFEFVLSPLDQPFELQIFEPRKRVNREFRSGFRHGARCENAQPNGAQDWSAWMEVDLDRLGWAGGRDDLTGNAFAILGRPDARRYFSLFLPPQTVPDYHLPEYFAKLPGL